MNHSDIEKWLGTPFVSTESADLSDDAAHGLASGQTTDVSFRKNLPKIFRYLPLVNEHGFEVHQYAGLPWFFVKPAEAGFIAKSTNTEVGEEDGGFVLNLSDPGTAVAIVTEQNEGLAFSFESGTLHAALFLNLATPFKPDIDSPLEELSLDLVDVDPWLSDKSFELLNASDWGEVVGMGLIGRHRPVAADTIAAIKAAAAGAPLVLPKPVERRWFAQLSQESKDWVARELKLRIQDLVGDLEDVLHGAEPREQLMLDRDDIESVCWVSGFTDELLSAADKLGESLAAKLPKTKDEQLLKAAIDCADRWWTKTV